MPTLSVIHGWKLRERLGYPSGAFCVMRGSAGRGRLGGMCKQTNPREELLQRAQHLGRRSLESQQLDLLIGIGMFGLRLLEEIRDQEVKMGAEQSSEAKAMQDAIDGLNTELADVSAVDAEIQADLVALPELLAKIQPSSPEQVNAITAVTSTLQSLTAKLKEAAAPAEAAEQAASGQGGGDQGGGSPPAQAATLYVFDSSSGAAADERFSASGLETAPPEGAASPLEVFSGDTAPGEKNGAAVAGYAVYEGPTKEVAAS